MSSSKTCCFVVALYSFSINMKAHVFEIYIIFMFQSPGDSSPSAASCLTHLAVEQRVVVPPHLRVDVVEVPLKAFTLQTLPQRDPLRDVSVIDSVVLRGQSHSLGGGSLCFARGPHGRLMVTVPQPTVHLPSEGTLCTLSRKIEFFLNRNHLSPLLPALVFALLHAPRSPMIHPRLFRPGQF